MNMIKGLKKVVPPHRRGAKLAAASDPSIEIIRKRAYELFLARGATHGSDLSDWFKAEQDSARRPNVSRTDWTRGNRVLSRSGRLNLNSSI